MSAGMITNLDGENFTFEFEFYPESISYPRQVDYSFVDTPGLPIQDVNYSGGKGFKNSFVLLIDGLESGDTDYVNNQIDFLESLTYPEKSTGSGLKDQQFKVPPKLKVILDGRTTPCVLENIETTPLMNFSNGKMARAEVKCNFIEIYYQGLSDALYAKRLSSRSKGQRIRTSIINTGQGSYHRSVNPNYSEQGG